MSREIANDEAREKFLERVRYIAAYWQQAHKVTLKEATEGVAFSILVLLDGGSAEMPAYKVIPSPHPDDRAFQESEGKDYYPTPALENNIAGQLHERFFTK